MARFAWLLPVVAILGVVQPFRPAHASRPSGLTFEDRVAAQEAIERVYFAHQAGEQRRFEEAVPRPILEARVRRYLAESKALRQVWGTPVTAEMLRDELSRIAHATHMPARLRVNPGAPETCNGSDDNCDTRIDDGFDADLDGVTTCGGDCNDFDPGAWSMPMEVDGHPLRVGVGPRARPHVRRLPVRRDRRQPRGHAPRSAARSGLLVPGARAQLVRRRHAHPFAPNALYSHGGRS